MPSYFYAVTHLYRLCGHVFMQLRIYTAYAATLLCSPFMRSCFCAVMLFYADEAFTRSRFYAAEPFTQAHFTQLRFLCSHAFTLYWMEMVLRGTDLRLGALGMALPLCGAMGQSSQPARSSPGRPKEMEPRPYFPRMASMVRSSFSRSNSYPPAVCFKWATRLMEPRLQDS